MEATFVSRYWHGEGPLWQIYWLYGVIGSFILLGLFLMPLQSMALTPTYYVITGVVMCLYTAWILVSVWRCADNVANPRWTQVARLLTVFWALNVLLVGAFLGVDLFFG
ncbi:MAG: hypothetical protein PVF40_08085 [Ectothiorhodospiraceae bacterium]|jgi:hypothetical protein